MSIWASYLLLGGLMGPVLLISACSQSAKGGSGPMQFLEARTSLLARDMVEVNASVLNPIEDAYTAYADCVAAQHAMSRGMPYLRRVTTKVDGLGDVVVENTTYLLSPVAPNGDFVLNAGQVVAKCKANNVPTV